MKWSILSTVFLCSLSLAGQKYLPIEHVRTVLGILPDASSEDAKKAYRQLVFKWHPDRNGNSEYAAGKYREVVEAWEALQKYEQNPMAYVRRGHVPPQNSTPQRVVPKTAAEWDEYFTSHFHKGGLGGVLERMGFSKNPKIGDRIAFFSLSKDQLEGLIAFSERIPESISKGLDRDISNLNTLLTFNTKGLLSPDWEKRRLALTKNIFLQKLENATNVGSFIYTLSNFTDEDLEFMQLSKQDLLVRNNKLIFEEKFGLSTLEVLASVANERPNSQHHLYEFWNKYKTILTKYGSAESDLPKQEKEKLATKVFEALKDIRKNHTKYSSTKEDKVSKSIINPMAEELEQLVRLYSGKKQNACLSFINQLIGR